MKGSAFSRRGIIVVFCINQDELDRAAVTKIPKPQGQKSTEVYSAHGGLVEL